MIATNEYQRDLAGHSVVDCAVRARDMYCLVVQNDEQAAASSVISQGKVKKRVIMCFLDEPYGDQLGSTELTGFETLRVGASTHPKSQVIAVDGGGQVYVLGSGDDEIQANIPRALEGPLRGGVDRLRTIDGWLFMAGGFHSVARRLGKNQWENLCLNLPQVTRADADDVDRSDNMSFRDIDGFSSEELYAIAGKGRVWRLKDRHWARMPFPSNMYLESVCCAGDGYVYIGAQSGALYRGRDERWELIHGTNLTLPFHDIVWHAGRLWCTSSYGLWTLDGNQLVRADVPAEVMVCAGHLSVADGVMLMAGTHGAALHDGQQWQVIFNRLAMEEATKE